MRSHIPPPHTHTQLHHHHTPHSSSSWQAGWDFCSRGADDRTDGEEGCLVFFFCFVFFFFSGHRCRCQTRFSPADLRQAAARHRELSAAASVSLLNYHRRVSKHRRSELMPESSSFFFPLSPQIWNKAVYFLFALHHHHHHHHHRPGAAYAAWVRYSSLQQRIQRFIGESSVFILCMCSNLDTSQIISLFHIWVEKWCFRWVKSDKLVKMKSSFAFF